MSLSGDLQARCYSDARALSEVQGRGDASPLAGQTVTVEGVITFDSRHPEGWGGFYLQQPDAGVDDNPRTSEALFVYTSRPGGKAGARVRVTGRVKEYHGLTELVRVSELLLCGTEPLPEPIPVDLPWPGQQPPEHLENMRVALPGPLTLIGHYAFARYGELILADTPQVMPTEVIPPGPDARAMAAVQALNRLYLDDGRSTRDPETLPWPAPQLAKGEPVRAGDRFSGLAGILDFRFGQWRLQPTREPRLSVSKPRPRAPARTASTTLRVVTLNLGNFFNGDGPGGGFADGRGARNQRQLAQQTARLAKTLAALDADVIAAVEMENDDYGRTSAIARLTAALGHHWRFVATPGATGSDAIRTDLLYRADRAAPVGEPLRLRNGYFQVSGRPPIAQVFRPLAGSTRASVRVVVPHFKSKACGRASGADKDQKDGQGCYARRRADEAEALAAWLASLPEPESTDGTFAGTLVTGDLNSYAREWPLQRLEQGAGLVNLVRSRRQCTTGDCPQTTFRYQGRHGSLDYSLGTSELLENYLVDAGVWSVNADEFPAIGYQGPIALPEAAPWRSSDHDPVYTDLAL